MKVNLKKPYSFSLRQKIIEDIRYCKQTVPEQDIDQKVEEFIQRIVPMRSNGITNG